MAEPTTKLPDIVRLPMSFSINMLNNISASPVLDQLGLREPTEQILYHGVRLGALAGSQFQSNFKKLKQLMPEGALQKAEQKPADIFDLTPTEEQQMVRDMLEGFAKDYVAPAAGAIDISGEINKDIIAGFQEMGITTLGIPVDLDGANTMRSPMSNTLVAEDLARGDMSVALALLAPLSFVNLLTEFGSLHQQSKYLPHFTGDRFVPASVALMEPVLRFDAHELKTHANKAHNGYVLSGEKCMVPLGAKAEVFMVFADLEGVGPRAFIVEHQAEGVEVKEEQNMGLKGAGLANVKLNHVYLPNESLLGELEVPYDHNRMLSLAQIGACALAVGTCQSVVDYVIEYCNTRVAFGEPISHRQAVAFKIADMAIELESMRMLTYRAAGRAEKGLDFQREAYLAHTLCAQKSMQIGTDGVQLLGGHGYTREHPVERWYRQLRSTGIIQGNPIV